MRLENLPARLSEFTLCSEKTTDCRDKACSKSHRPDNRVAQDCSSNNTDCANDSSDNILAA